MLALLFAKIRYKNSIWELSESSSKANRTFPSFSVYKEEPTEGLAITCPFDPAPAPDAPAPLENVIELGRTMAKEVANTKDRKSNNKNGIESLKHIATDSLFNFTKKQKKMN